MYLECRNYLILKLQDAGLKTKPVTSMKRLKLSQEAHIGAVLPSKETFDRSGAKTRYRDQTGAQHKRRKVFSRELTFSVILGDPDPTRTEEMFDTFLQSLDVGIYIDENFTGIEVGEAEWVEDEDSILKAKVAVNVEVKFSGGVYKDTGFARLTDIEIQSVEKGDSV